MVEAGDVMFAKRTGYGTEGRPVKLLANFFNVRLALRAPTFYMYSVEVYKKTRSEPRKIEPRDRDEVDIRHVMRCCWEQHPRIFADVDPVYDGFAILYTVRKLPEPSGECDVAVPEEPPARGFGEPSSKRPRGGSRDSLYLVKYNLSQTISTASLTAHVGATRFPSEDGDALHVLDTALRSFLSAKFSIMKNAVFSRSFGHSDLREGIEAWSGFNVALRPCQGPVLKLNLDLATVAVVKSVPVLAFLAEVIGPDKVRPTHTWSEQDIHKAKRHMKGKKVFSHHTGRTCSYKVKDLTREPVGQLRFPKEVPGRDGDGEVVMEMVSMTDYFLAEYNLRLQTNLPCINAGNEKKRRWLPMELCTISGGQRHSKMLTGPQLATLGRERKKPEECRAAIERAVHDLHLAQSRELQAYGLHVETDMVQVQGRVLPPPSLVFTRAETPRDGQWNMGRMDNRKRVTRAGARVDSWMVVSFLDKASEGEVRGFANNLRQCLASLGLEINPTPGVFRGKQGRDPKSQISATFKMMKEESKQAPQLLLWLLDSKTSPHYAVIKSTCNLEESNMGIPSQCVAPGRDGRLNNSDQYLVNVALKINGKLGGVNWRTEVSVFPDNREPSMIMGMDVSHAGPEGLHPSIAAAVGSFDSEYSRYACSVRFQARRQESILELQSMGEELLTTFKDKTGVLPTRLVVFRDGVSESQFIQVMKTELTAVREACKTVGCAPRITLVVVQKRHGVRLFPSGGRGNVEPGTIVDSHITHPNFFDFYMCPHKGIIGTTRPARYTVLHDENNFTANEIQRLVHNLSYMNARCTKAVSLVPPVMYAHLAAGQFRKYVETDGSDIASSSIGRKRGSSDADTITDFSKFPKLDKRLKTKMFFL